MEQQQQNLEQIKNQATDFQDLQNSSSTLASQQSINQTIAAKKFYQINSMESYKTSTRMSSSNTNSKKRQIQNKIFIAMKYDFLISTSSLGSKNSKKERAILTDSENKESTADDDCERSKSSQSQSLVIDTTAAHHQKRGAKTVDIAREHLSLNYQFQLVEGNDVLVSFTDIQVWLLNKSHQIEIQVFQQLWEKVEGEKLQKKSLNQFLQLLASFITTQHRQFQKLEKQINEINVLYKNANELASINKIKSMGKNYKPKFNKTKFSFHLGNFELLGANQDKVFMGESLGFYAKIYFQNKKILMTQLKEINHLSVKWKESFTLDVYLLCGWFDVKIYEVFSTQKSDDNIEQQKIGECRLDLFSQFMKQILAFRDKQKLSFNISLDVIKDSEKLNLEALVKKGLKKTINAPKIQPDSLIPRQQSQPEVANNNSQTSSQSEKITLNLEVSLLMDSLPYLEQFKTNLVHQRIKALDKFVKIKRQSNKSNFQLLHMLVSPFQGIFLDQNEITVSPELFKKKSGSQNNEGCNNLKCNNSKCTIF